MLQANVIGHLGSDAEFKSENGREFTTFRIANTDRWTDQAGTVHEETTWVDCIMNGKPGVLDYLKKGTQVYVSGSLRLRVYSSAKDRCMKAGCTVQVRTVELLGGSKSDDVPRALFDPNTGAQVDVTKWYYAAACVRDESQPELLPLVSRSQERFVVSREGWVTKFGDNDQ